MNVQQFAQVYHTVRHLRPVQVFNRLQRRWLRPSWRCMHAPARRMPAGTWQPCCRREPVLVGPHELRVFGQTVRLETAADWCRSSLPRLVQYNLHYFDDLTASNSETRAEWQRSLVSRWIDQHRPGQNPGWEPYPLSLRIVNWIKWFLAGERPSVVQLDSLATQVQALDEQLEYHLLGNHLLANAKALVFAGAFFEGPAAERWLRRGARLLREQLAEQILADGGHFELSPMYHAIILEDVLDLLNLTSTFPQAIPAPIQTTLRGIAERMLVWLAALTHPDGQIAFFNDAAWGVAATSEELSAYASRLRVPVAPAPAEGVAQLIDSGYVRLQRGDSVLLVDLARVGPDYQPGHAHADTLSFEWSLAGQRVIVNSGTSTYEPGDQRRWQRSTAAHSTVEVDGVDSSEVWGTFRVARRARPGRVEIVESPTGLSVAGSHDGYRRLRGRVVHARRWSLRDDSLQVTDQLYGAFHSAVARFYFAPRLTLDLDAGSLDFVLRAGEQQLTGCIVGGAPRRVSSTYSRRFGESQGNSRLESTLLGPAHELLIHWPVR